MRMIAGLEEISDGAIYLGERKVNDVPPAGRNVAMAFENYGLYPHRTVFGNIAYPLQLRGKSSESIAQAVADIAALLHIADILEKHPRELSVGAKQRVSLARALIRDPAVFLMDEPLSHVDAQLRSQMRSEIKRIHYLNGSTTIYVTHDQLEALTMADRIVVMNKGVVQQIGTPDEIYESPANRFVATFVGEPPMNMLRGLATRNGDVITLEAEGASLTKLARDLGGISTGDKVEVGIRPADLELAPGHADGLGGTVSVREVIGSSALLTVETMEHRLQVKVDASLAPAEGDPVRLRFPAEHIHLFDIETGDAIGSRRI
jgi:ABC-type sugar transport system ATPase subunit